ncbi:MAG: phosphoglycerate mutase (2,3-diphosphoglycerate-independent) [Candidatus Magasanikbacteria bacterium CG11_big_fil_rev_8_21_14_0_20_39_34]|uniref:2,3-bisphosphoglycerate-independent phosphoglycerate mutase n=1 Tax=Candidatus Magasanikbacteria bacterium CG11_big_fil_rev_8_21_14_0_20_39_34 TaxID=1974653 RepID=A0A2H0N5X9_9BACT|nr:MAG: phosphoglycerate mutase (2,3-diphosphoglycerate-independent) [Candidatus Magasanikbacteria bacterium CG11_big_fil_rev_8_21_14_0_20_39_34]
MSERPKPLVLAILDGFGVAPPNEGNAITTANTPNFKKFITEYPAMTLLSSGNEVGLRFGEMGNSEVGHLNIGAGRVYYQTFPRINNEIASGEFFQKQAFLDACKHAKKNGSKLHIMGILSPGNVHGSQDHCYALLDLAKRQGVEKVYVHAFLDGRDTVYNTAKDFIIKLQEKMKELGVGELASLCGRYFAMDRDNRWERIEKAYRAVAEGISEQYFKNPLEAVEESYKKEIYDEQFVPVVLGTKEKPIAKVEDGDAVIFFNFRPDRARQITKAFVLPSFQKFERTQIQNLHFVTMTEYEKDLPVIVAYAPVVIENCLAEILSKAGLKQVHIAETEKYAHVTFFLNGTVEDEFENESRVLVSSPKVESYDMAPEMSAPEVTKEVIKAIDSAEYDVILLNFANADMVGHTGNLEATIKAIETIDSCLGKIADHTLAKNGVLLITADHGNAESMVNLQTGEKDKEHSNNPVPFLIIGKNYQGQAGPSGDPPGGDLSLMPPVGMLADVAPTILSILGVDIPPEMTGRALM